MTRYILIPKISMISMISTILTILLLAGCTATQEPPVFGEVPDFVLIERSERQVQRADLEGRVWVADFIFTRCAATCPLMSRQMKRLQDTLPEEVQLVSFTVDPGTDTPEVLSRYAAAFGAHADRWWFLTGLKDDLYRLSIEGFKLGIDDTMGTEAEPITHSTRFVLVDREGRIRGYYAQGEESDFDRLTADVKTLL